MTCKGCLECLLKLLNFLLTVSGLAMVGYGIYLFVEWKRITDLPDISPSTDNFVQLSRPMLLVVSLSESILDKLPKAWFIYLFIGIGAILFVISCFGCIGAVTRNGCCLSCVGARGYEVDSLETNVIHSYSLLVILLILAELGCAAFIFFDKSWQEAIPADKTGDFDMIYSFLEKNWNIAKWVALGVVILEALVFVLALIVRAANRPADYDSDDEYIAPRSGVRQPLINRQAAPAAGVPVVAALDNRPSRNDAWSTRMREKYGLDTSEFTYNPSEANRQPTAPPAEEGSRCACTIM